MEPSNTPDTPTREDQPEKQVDSTPYELGTVRQWLTSWLKTLKKAVGPAEQDPDQTFF